MGVGETPTDWTLAGGGLLIAVLTFTNLQRCVRWQQRAATPTAPSAAASEMRVVTSTSTVGVASA